MSILKMFFLQMCVVITAKSSEFEMHHPTILTLMSVAMEFFVLINVLQCLNTQTSGILRLFLSHCQFLALTAIGSFTSLVQAS